MDHLVVPISGCKQMPRLGMVSPQALGSDQPEAHHPELGLSLLPWSLNSGGLFSGVGCVEEHPLANSLSLAGCGSGF